MEELKAHAESARTFPGVASAELFRRAIQASYWRRSSSNRWMMAVLFDIPFAISLPWKAGRRLRTQFADTSKRARDPDDARTVFETLHPDPRRVERGADRHRPMVREQPSHVPREIRLEPVAPLRRPRRPIGDEGHIPPLQDKLRQDQYMPVFARDRQTGPHGGGRLHDRPYAGSAGPEPHISSPP